VKFIRELCRLFEKQHVTIAGIHEGRRIVAATDRRLMVLERYEESDEEDNVECIPSFKIGSIDPPVDIPSKLGEDGRPVLPEGTEMVTSAEEAKEYKKGELEAAEAIAVIGKLRAVEKPLKLPVNLHTLKEDWLAFRLEGGHMFVRTAKEYGDLGEATEVDMGACDAEFNCCFAVPVLIFKVCHQLADGEIKTKLSRTRDNTFAVFEMKDAGIYYSCKPLLIVENPVKKAEQKSGTPNNEPEEKKSEEPKVEEPKVEEPKVEEPKVEEPKAEEPKAEEPKAEEPKAEEPKAEEPEEGGEETPPDGEETPPSEEKKPAVEDVDPLVALDEIMPGLMKAQLELNQDTFKQMRVLIRNVGKQCRKALKSQADPEEVKTLKRKLAAAEKARDTAQAELAALKASLDALKRVL